MTHTATNKLPNQLCGGLWMMLAGLAFACVNNTLQYLAINFSVPSTTQVFLQYTFAVLFLLPFLRKHHIKAMAFSDHRALHFLRIILSIAGIQLWTWGLAHVPIWQVIALSMTSPLFATLGSKLFLKETVNGMRWLATSVGFLGAMLILAPWTDDFSLYALLPVGAAIFWASASLLTKYTLSDDSPVTVISYMLISMVPINGFLALPELTFHYGAITWILLIATGLLTLIAQWAIAKAYSCADASYVQPFDHLKLLFNVLIGYWVFNSSTPGEWWYVGVALIISATTLMSLSERQANAVLCPSQK